MIDALARYVFLQHAVAAVVLGSISCGLIGSLLFVNRMSGLAGGVSHAVFGGLGAALLAGVHPLLGASVAGLAASLVLGMLSARRRERADAAIAAVWSVGMSLGLVFVSLAPGYRGDLMGYLFGSVLAVTREDLLLTLFVGLAATAFVAGRYRSLLAVSYDPEFSTARGLPIGRLYTVFLCLTGLTVVVLMRSVGLVMVIALTTVPPATARIVTHDLARMMVLACLLSAAAGLSGLWLSWTLDLPAGAMVVLSSASFFGLVALARSLVRKPYRSVTVE
jgi:zinc transport system permease protein